MEVRHDQTGSETETKRDVIDQIREVTTETAKQMFAKRTLLFATQSDSMDTERETDTMRQSEAEEKH